MSKINPARIKRIMVRVTNWIGDGVMNTPALGAIRATFPQAEIVVVANPIVAELFSHHPYCDRVLVYDKKGVHKGIRGLLSFCSSLRQENFELAILLQKAVEAAIMAFLARVPLRIGYATDGRGLLLTHRVPLTAEVRCQHHTQHYMHMLRQFGIEGGDGEQLLQCSPDEVAWAGTTLGEGRWVAINPGAAYGSAKRWIPERFAEVGDKLAERYGVKVLLTGGPGEQEIGRDIEKAMAHRPLNLIDKTSVRQMMAVLSQCRLLVSNDSGPMHVGAALGVPIVAIFGSTDHTTTYPYTNLRKVVRKEIDCAPCLKRQCPTDHRCMEAVTAEDVFIAARELMGE